MAGNLAAPHHPQPPRHTNRSRRQTTASSCRGAAPAKTDDDTTGRRGEPPGGELREAYWNAIASSILEQLQLIRDAMVQRMGESELTTMIDAASQLVINIDLNCATEGGAESPRTRGRKRALGEPNALGEALRQVRLYRQSRGGTLSPADMGTDMAQILLMVDTGGVQLLEPMPPHMTPEMLQQAGRQAQRAGHLLDAAKVGGLTGDTSWNNDQFWTELENLLVLGADLLDSRGDAFEPTSPASSGKRHGGDSRAHPADVLALAAGASEARTTTSGVSTAVTQILRAVTVFGNLVMPTLEGNQVPPAAELLHAITAWQQTLFGGYLSVDGETQTDELGGALPDPAMEVLRGEYDHHGEPELRDAEHNGTTMDNSAGEPAMLTRSQMQELMSSSLQAAVDEVAAMPTLPDVGSEEGGATASTVPWRPPSQFPNRTIATNLGEDARRTTTTGVATVVGVCREHIMVDMGPTS